MCAGAVGVAGRDGDGFAHLRLAQYQRFGRGAGDGHAASFPLVRHGAHAVQIGQGVGHRQGLALFDGAAEGHAAGGRIVHRADIDPCGVRDVQRMDAVAVAEQPVDLHAGRWRVRAVGVADAGKRFVDPLLRRAGIKSDDQLAARVADAAHFHARERRAAARQTQMAQPRKQVLAGSAAVAAEADAGTAVVACAAIERGQFGVVHGHAGVEGGGFHRPFDVACGAAQGGAGAPGHASGQVAKAGVQRAVGVQADHAEVRGAAAAGAVARQHQLAVALHGHAVGLIVVAADVDQRLAVVAEAGVQRSVGVQADHAEVRGAAAVGAAAREHNLAVALHGHAVGLIAVAADINHSLAVAAEAGVERAVGVQADHAEVIDAEVVGAVACDDHLAVALHRHAVRLVVVAADIDHELTAPAYAGVGRAIGVQADHGEVVVAAAVQVVACQHNLAVALQRHALALAVIEDVAPAVTAKTGVERAVGVQADHAEVGLTTVRGDAQARHHNLAVTLHRHALAFAVVAVVEDGVNAHLAIVAEAGVGRAVGVEAHHAEVGGGVGCAGACEHDFAVALHAHAVGLVAVAIDINQRLAVRAEAGVGRAVSLQAHDAEIGSAAAVGAVACDQHAAVALHGHAVGLVVVAADIDQRLACARRRCRVENRRRVGCEGDGGAVGNALRRGAGAVAEQPVDLHAGARCVGRVGVADAGKRFVDPILRRAGVEGDDQLAASVAHAAHAHARKRGMAARQTQVAQPRKHIVAGSATVAAEGKAGAAVVARAAIEGRQFGVVHGHAGVEQGRLRHAFALAERAVQGGVGAPVHATGQAAKSGVQRAVGVQAHDAEVAVVSGAGDQNLAVVLHGHAVGCVGGVVVWIKTCHRNDLRLAVGLGGGVATQREPAIGAKAGVGRAVGVQAHQTEAALFGEQNLAVVLNGHALAHAAAQHGLAVLAEAGVQRAIGVEPDQGEAGVT